MADADFSAAPSVPAHPNAKSGYGKRSAPDQAPRGAADFVHLRPREAALAAYIDRLPDGAAIGYKALAENVADYGQQACAKALNFLSDAGHLRRVKEHLELEDSSFRWVTRTYYSRTARDDDWWTAFVRGLRGVDLTQQARQSEQQPAESPQEPRAERSVAYRTLARLGRTEPRMTLSAAECEALEELAAAWLERGATPDHLTRALTSGLPDPLHNPGALARKRLESKMPPKPTTHIGASAPVRINRSVMICFGCDEPETVVTLLRGVCQDCREEMAAYDAAEEAGEVIDAVPDTFRTVPAQVDVARRAAEARAAAGFRAKPVPSPMKSDIAQVLTTRLAESTRLP